MVDFSADPFGKKRNERNLDDDLQNDRRKHNPKKGIKNFSLFRISPGTRSPPRLPVLIAAHRVLQLVIGREPGQMIKSRVHRHERKRPGDKIKQEDQTGPAEAALDTFGARDHDDQNGKGVIQKSAEHEGKIEF